MKGPVAGQSLQKSPCEGSCGKYFGVQIIRVHYYYKRGGKGTALSFAPQIQQSPCLAESVAQLGDGSGSLPFNPPLASKLAQVLVNTRMLQGSLAFRLTFHLTKGQCRHQSLRWYHSWAWKPSLVPVHFKIKLTFLSQAFKV